METLTLSSLPSLDEIAGEIWKERGCVPGNDKQDWYDAERRALERYRERVSQLAYALWEKRGWQVHGSPERWAEAERLVLWAHWARTKLHPYLALECIAAPSGTAEKLESNYPLKKGRSAGLIAVLDGAPEYSRHWHWYAEVSKAKERPESTVERKDAAFYELCCQTLQYYGGMLGGKNPKVSPQSPAAPSRLFQDACFAAFGGEDPIRSALLAAYRVRRTLLKHNEALQLPWSEQFHVRLAIGSTWGDAIRCIPFSFRDEIAIPPSVLRMLEPDSTRQSLLIASGIKVGPCRG